MSGDPKKRAVILFAHGSRVEAANRSVEALAEKVGGEGSYAYVKAAFLELAQPDLSTSIDQAMAAGKTHLIVIPYFLTTGIHLKRDLPELIAEQRQRHPGLEIGVGEPLEGHPLLTSLILQRVQEVVGKPTLPPNE